MRYSLLVLTLLALATSARAQTFVGGGVVVNRSSSYDPSPVTRGDGGQTFVGGYVEGGYQFPLGLHARVLGEYNSDVALRSIFTSDAATGLKTNSELRLRGTLLLRPGCKDARFCLVIGGGVDHFRQRLTEMQKAKYSYGEPAAGLNPFFVVGAEFGKAHEVAFSRLFTDKTAFNDSSLHGYRVGYAYARQLAGHLRFKAWGEVDYVIYRDSVGRYVATYTKRDAVFKLRLGLIYL